LDAKTKFWKGRQRAAFSFLSCILRRFISKTTSDDVATVIAVVESKRALIVARQAA